MKDVRHEHPLNDPEHQRTCEHCQQMDVLGVRFAGWLEDLNLNHQIDDGRLITFLLVFVANVTLDHAAEPPDGLLTEEQLPVLREAMVREAGQAFDAAVLGMRQDQGA